MNVHNQEGLLSSFQKVPCREMQESEGHREFSFKSKKKKKKRQISAQTGRVLRDGFLL